MANRIKGITVEIGGDVTGLDKALKDVNGTIKNTQSQLKDVERLLKLDPTNTELLNQKQKLLKESIGATKDKLEALKTAQEQAKQQLENGDLGKDKYDALQREIIATEQELKNLEEQAKKSNATLAKISEAGKKFEEVGGKVTKVGEGLSTHVTAPIVAIGAASMAAFNEVDGAMDTVIKKTGATGEKLEGLQTTVTNLATSIPTDFQTAADAVGEVATRFDDVGDELEDLSGKFIKFAQLNNTDVSTAVDNVQASMAAFGVPTKDAGAVLDVLNGIAQQTGVDINSLTSSMTTNAGVMKEMGFSFEDSAVFLGNLNKNGVDASGVMTGLKKAWQTASKDGKSMDDVLKEMNTTILSAKTDQEAYQAAIEVFGSKAGPAIAQAVRDGRLSLDELNVSMSDFAGNIETTFEATLDPIDQNTLAMNELKATGAEIASTLQELLSPVLETVREKLKALREWWSGLSEDQQQNIIKIAAVVAAIGPLLVVFGKVITVIGTIMQLAPALGGVIAALSGPVGIVIAAITAAIAVGVLLYKNWDTIKEKAHELAEKVKEKWNDLKEKTSTKFSEIKESISQKMSEAKQHASEKASEIKETVSNKFSETKENALQKFEEIKEGIREKIESAKEKVREAIEKIKDFFNFHWELPKLKMPHFSISGSFSLNPPSVPHLSVEWYKKAMNNGMILNSPTIFGMKNGNLLAGGEAGSETVVGTNALLKMIQNAVENAGASYGDVNVFINDSTGKDVSTFAKEIGQAVARERRIAGSW